MRSRIKMLSYGETFIADGYEGLLSTRCMYKGYVTCQYKDREVEIQKDTLILKIERMENANLISRIADRAVSLLGFKKITVFMDIDICHKEACPLNLGALLSASDADFAHDIYGINSNLNHKTHKLDNCFVPRFAKV